MIEEVVRNGKKNGASDGLLVETRGGLSLDIWILVNSQILQKHQSNDVAFGCIGRPVRPDRGLHPSSFRWPNRSV